ncbi:hypothetical protein T11_8414 [Trichinella zimbabwensis]|uniref:Uncharacterized protein n=1 Tax=Trichinella zimbabwensis TaxID=268475 RepID=A0A0V1HV02_9BILA|nr:hypothetical protein T11_8414 [Trichinella zimbabwensis]
MRYSTTPLAWTRCTLDFVSSLSSLLLTTENKIRTCLVSVGPSSSRPLVTAAYAVNGNSTIVNCLFNSGSERRILI